MNKKINNLKFMVAEILRNKKGAFPFRKVARENALEFGEDLFDAALNLYDEYFHHFGHIVFEVTELKNEVASDHSETGVHLYQCLSSLEDDLEDVDFAVQFEHLEDFIEAAFNDFLNSLEA